MQGTIDTALAIKAVNPRDLERVIVDTTVQEKAIAHPVDSRLIEIARHKVVSAAKRAGIQLKQTYAKEGKELRRRAGGYAHAKQFRRTRKLTFPGNPYDGHILNAALEQATSLMQDHAVVVKQIVVDLGFRGVDADTPMYRSSIEASTSH